MVKCIWSTSRESSHLAWKNLERRFLAKVTREGEIWMHRVLRNLGESVACPQNNSIEKWTRISRSSCAKELITKHQGVVNTLGLRLGGMEKEILTLRNTTFLDYIRLEYLILEGVRTSPGTLALPKSLVYLRWTDGLFTYCPIDFTHLEKLVALELIDCRSMRFLSASVVKARKLIWLELGGCLSLAGLPLGLPRFLEHLGLNKTSLKKLPSDHGKLKGLRHLQANETQLREIPQGLGRLEMLSSLNLRGTRLTSLPESIGDLKRLKKLSLRETMVNSLPDSIGRLQELKVLDLGSTKLVSLPESIGGLTNLEDLSLFGTNVKSLPQSLGGLVHLTSLDCSYTPLETLPDAICDLHHLSSLRLSETQITGLPDAMGELVALQKLTLDSPRLSGWWKTTGRSSLINMLTVDLGPLCKNPAIFSEPGEVDGRGEENALAVRDGESEMGISSFLSQLPLLHAVVTLTLYGRGFPQYWLQPLFLALQSMPSLTILDLYSFDLVEVIPCELGTLTSLTHLNLCSFDLVEVIPCELGTLTKLEDLSLGFKTLRELPEFLGELTRLKRLKLIDMPKLGRLPESLSALPSLSSLQISRCPSLRSVPRSFSCVTPLESEASTSQGRDCGRLDSLTAINIVTSYMVPCKEMERALKEAVEEAGIPVLDRKVAREILTKVGLHLLGDGYRLQDGSRHCSSISSCCRVPTYYSRIYCDKYCDVHRYEWVAVSGEGRWRKEIRRDVGVTIFPIGEDIDGTEHKDSVVEHQTKGDEDSEDEESEVLLVKYLHALLPCLFCSR